MSSQSFLRPHNIYHMSQLWYSKFTSTREGYVVIMKFLPSTLRHRWAFFVHVHYNGAGIFPMEIAESKMYLSVSWAMPHRRVTKPQRTLLRLVNSIITVSLLKVHVIMFAYKGFSNRVKIYLVPPCPLVPFLSTSFYWRLLHLPCPLLVPLYLASYLTP